MTDFTRVLLALGSNIEPERNLPRAFRELRRNPDIRLTAASPVYASESIDRPGDPRFHNAAAMIETLLDPESLRLVLRTIESHLGRVRTDDRFAPRTIDIDIAMYEGLEATFDDLELPDPEIPKRSHLAVPLADVAPDWIHPGTGTSLGEIASTVERRGLTAIGGGLLVPINHDARYATETRMEEAVPDEVYDPELEGNVRALLVQLGEDPERQGLTRTPLRVAKALDFLTSGYTATLPEVVNNAVFESDADEMVLVKDIEFYSLCEHHMLPFFGKATVAYLPRGRIIGLSKIARIVDLFSRRLQVQERLANQIADAVEQVLDPLGVAVVMEGNHFCMMMRGVQKQGSSMVTSAMRGSFKKDARTRAEFLELLD